MKFEPFFDNVLIRPNNPEIHAPNAVTGAVIAVGDGTEQQPQKCFVGQEVAYLNYAAQTIRYDDGLFHVVRCCDVIGVFVEQ